MANTGEDDDPVAHLPLPAIRHYPVGPYAAEHAPPVAWTTFIGSASLDLTVDDLYRFDRALRSGCCSAARRWTTCSRPSADDRRVLGS